MSLYLTSFAIAINKHFKHKYLNVYLQSSINVLCLKLTDEQVKVSIVEFLVKKGRWGARYLPTDTLVNFLSRKIRRNGKRIRKCMKDLVDEGYILVHKRGETISLNPAKSREILEFIRSYGNLPNWNAK